MAAPPQPGAQRITYKVGPLMITPGQNRIDYTVIKEKPQVDGYITRIRPDLIYANGKVPRVDILHLHHGVWANLGRKDATSASVGAERFFAAGEEKTIFTIPEGYGYAYHATDVWVLNHMIHNLITTPTQVYLTYTIDFIPATAPQAASIRPVRPIWMDVQNGKVYPVFDVPKGAGCERARTRTRRRRRARTRATASCATSGPSTTTACSWRPPATCIPAACTPTSGCSARGRRRKRDELRLPAAPGGEAPLRREPALGARRQGAPVPLGREVLRARGCGVLGRRDDRDARGLEGQAAQGRRAVHDRDLRLQAGRLVRVDGDHGRLHGRRRAGRGPVREARRLARQGHARPPRGERNHGGRKVVYPDPRKLPDGVFAPGRDRHPRVHLPVRRPGAAGRARPAAGGAARAVAAVHAARPRTTGRRSTTR